MPANDQTENITFYTFVMSPYSAKVHCYLLYKELDFQCFYVNPLIRKKQLPIGQQAPALTIDDESRVDSTPIGLWLEERFPGHPALLPEDEFSRKTVLDIDNWVTNRLIPTLFRLTQKPGINLGRFTNAWALARVMHLTAHGGLPFYIRWLWPVIVSQQAFLKNARKLADPESSDDELIKTITNEFLDHLGDGPFLGSRDEPSLADFSAYPQFILPYVAGLRGNESFFENQKLRNWVARVDGILAPKRPKLFPPVAVIREIPTMLETA